MKRETCLFIALSCVAGGGLWAAMGFRGAQEAAFHQAALERNALAQANKSLRTDVSFLTSHQQKVDSLTAKGWFSPKNRLIAGEFLEGLRPLLRDVSYRFDPETVREGKEGVSFKVTQISFDATPPSDVAFYAFVEALLGQFPGVLILRELTLKRQETGIQGKVIVEWIAMGGEEGAR